jgi:hypothetical protein
MPISLFIRPVYRQNRPVGDFIVQILNQMDFGRFSPNFTEFGRFFQKPAGSEGADFLVSDGFLNTAFHNSTPSASVNDVDLITHLAKTYSKQPQFLRAYSYLTYYEALYVLQ